MAVALYEIEKSLAEITQRIIDNGGEVDEAAVEALALGEIQLEQKALAYGYVIVTAEAECDMIDIEIERLSKLKKARKRAAEYLRETISAAMQRYGVKEAKTPTLKLSFRKSTAVQIVNPEQLPPEYNTVTMSVAPNKANILRDLKAGIEVPGCVLEQRENLQIK